METITQTTTTVTQGERQATVTVTQIVRGRVYHKGKVGIGVVGPHRLIFQTGNILYKNQVVGQYDRAGYGQINGKAIKLKRQGGSFLLIEMRPAA